MNKGLYLEPLMAEEEAARTATPEELAQAAAFGSPSRRSEYLTWRAVVRRHVDPAARIAYDALGAPCLPDYPHIYISVSHCDGWVAVCISDRRCAVDIEPLSRDFRAVEARCIHPAERALDDTPLLPAVIWCAKECLYKQCTEQAGLDFRNDIRLLSLDLTAGRAAGAVRNGEPVELIVRQQHGLMIVYTKEGVQN